MARPKVKTKTEQISSADQGVIWEFWLAIWRADQVYRHVSTWFVLKKQNIFFHVQRVTTSPHLFSHYKFCKLMSRKSVWNKILSNTWTSCNSNNKIYFKKKEDFLNSYLCFIQGGLWEIKTIYIIVCKISKNKHYFNFLKYVGSSICISEIVPGSS